MKRVFKRTILRLLRVSRLWCAQSTPRAFAISVRRILMRVPIQAWQDAFPDVLDESDCGVAHSKRYSYDTLVFASNMDNDMRRILIRAFVVALMDFASARLRQALI